MRKKPLLNGLYFKKPDNLWIILLLAGMFFLSSLITLLILLSVTGGESAPTATSEPQISGALSSEGLMFHDFLLQDEDQFLEKSDYLLREQMARWGDEQVNRFWIPLKKIALDILIKENDNRVEEIFKDIP